MRFSSYAGRARGPPLLVGKDTCIRSGPASRSDSFGMPHLYYLCPQGQRIIECGVKAQVWRKGMQGRVSLVLVCTAQRWDSHDTTCVAREDSVIISKLQRILVYTTNASALLPRTCEPCCMTLCSGTVASRQTAACVFPQDQTSSHAG